MLFWGGKKSTNLKLIVYIIKALCVICKGYYLLWIHFPQKLFKNKTLQRSYSWCDPSLCGTAKRPQTTILNCRPALTGLQIMKKEDFFSLRAHYFQLITSQLSSASRIHFHAHSRPTVFPVQLVSNIQQKAKQPLFGCFQYQLWLILVELKAWSRTPKGR